MSQSSSPIFVVGTPRSGTTLTAEILGRHPDVLMPGELHFFEDMYSRRDSFGSLLSYSNRASLVDRMLSIYGRYNQPDQTRIDHLFGAPETRERLHAAAVDLRQLLATFMEVQLEATGKIRWGNNTPKDIFHVEAITSMFPDASFVICTRDPRDFLLSYKGRWQVSEHGQRLRSLYHPVLTSLLWRATTGQIPAVQAAAGPARCAIVSYESLVQEPAQTIRNLCNLLNLSFHESMLEVSENNSSLPTNDVGIFTSSVGRWHDGLTPEEVYLAEHIAGREMVSLGYTLANPKVNALRVAGHLASLPARSIAALWANRYHRGPTLTYLAQRFQALLR